MTTSSHLPKDLPGLVWDERDQKYYSAAEPRNIRNETKATKGTEAREERNVHHVLRERESTGRRSSLWNVSEAVGLKRTVRTKSETTSRCSGGIVPVSFDESNETERLGYVCASRGDSEGRIVWIGGRDLVGLGETSSVLERMPHLTDVQAWSVPGGTLHLACTSLSQGARDGKLRWTMYDAGMGRDTHTGTHGRETSTSASFRKELVVKREGDLWTLDQVLEGRRISVGTGVGSFVVDTGRSSLDVIWKQKRKSPAVVSQQLNQEGTMLFNGRRDGVMVAWDLRASPTEGSPQSWESREVFGEDTGICALRMVRPEETQVVSGTYGGRVRLWDLRCVARPLHDFHGIRSSGKRYGISLGRSWEGRDAYLFAPGSDPVVHAWDLQTSRHLDTIRCEDGIPDALACVRWNEQLALLVATPHEESVYLKST